MVVVILVAVCDQGLVLAKQLFAPPYGFLGRTLIEIFGLFLDEIRIWDKDCPIVVAEFETKALALLG